MTLVTVPHTKPRLEAVARYRVIFGDCDPMRIMYYGNYLRLFEIGRAELFRQLGHLFNDYISRGLYLAAIEATCRYHKPARYDDELTIFAGFASATRATIEIAYEVRDDAGNGIASGSTRHAVVNDEGKAQKLPLEVRELVHRLTATYPSGHA